MPSESAAKSRLLAIADEIDSIIFIRADEENLAGALIAEAVELGALANLPIAKRLEIQRCMKLRGPNWGLGIFNLLACCFDPHANRHEQWELPAKAIAKAIRDHAATLEPRQRPNAPVPVPATSNDGRDEWLYRQCCKLEPYEGIKRALAKKTRWAQIDSLNGIKLAANRYAKSHKLPPPPSRQPGRKPPRK